MKYKLLTPYLNIMINSLLFFVLAPFVLLYLRGGINVVITDSTWIIILFFLLIIVYGRVWIVYIKPGINALFDIMFNSFITCKAICLCTYAEEPQWLLFGYTPKQEKYFKKMDFLRVLLICNGTKSSFKTTCWHSMENGKTYNVKYGKHSKVILSILSVEGKEMLEMVE